MSGHIFMWARRRALSIAAVGGLTLAIVGFFAPAAVEAAGGAYSLNFAAASPLDYPARSPAQLACPSPSGSSGRAANPLVDAAFGNPKSYVESLTPKDLALGQIVPFELKIDVSGSTAPEAGSISLSADWLAKTTSGDDFGFDTSHGLYCAFVDTADTATTDPGHNAKVASYSSSTVGAGTSNERIAGSIDVSGLDDGDSVVVELWVVLDKTIPNGASGNVQTSVTGARTSTGDTINVGAQTVPLKNVQGFITDKADLSVTKTDTPDPVVAGQPLTYTINVTNNSPDTVANGVTVTDTLDHNVSFVSATGATCTANTAAGTTTVTCDIGSLAPGATTTTTLVATVSVGAPDNDKSGNAEVGSSGSTCSGTFDLCNAVTVSATTADANSANNAYVQPTNVTPTNAALTVKKSVQESTYSKVGDVLHYSYLVTNTGNVTLTSVSVVDDKTSVTCPVSTLAAGATTTCTATYVVTQADLDAGSVTNHAYAKSGALQSLPDSTTVVATQVRALTIDKTAAESAFYAPGDVLHYRYVVTNTGNVTLNPLSVIDNKTTVTCPVTILAAGATTTCTATYTVTSADVVAGSVTNTAFAKSGATQSPPDSVTVPLVTVIRGGHVTVVKTLDGPVAGAESTFSFAVSCPTIGYTATLSVDATGGTGTASTPDVIPLGTPCQITETGTYPHWTLSSATPSTAGAPLVATVTAGVGSAAGTATFVNSRLMAPVTVAKTRVGDVAGAATDFTFELTCPAYVTTAGPLYPWAQQTLTVDTSVTPNVTAVSDPIPTGVECAVTETPTVGWQQTEPGAGAGATVVVPGTATFTNTRNAGALQLVKTVHTLAGPNQNIGDYVAGDPENTLVYTLTLSEAPPGELDHTGVLVSDYLPGYGPDAGNLPTTYVEGSATCSTGCPVTYDPTEHQLNWSVGDFGHADAPVVMTFRVTIDPPAAAADGSIPAGMILNVGWVQSLQQADIPSNQVKTPVVAVLGEKHRRPLPFTGSSAPLPLAWQLGGLLVAAGVALLAVQRRRRGER